MLRKWRTTADRASAAADDVADGARQLGETLRSASAVLALVAILALVALGVSIVALNRASI